MNRGIHGDHVAVRVFESSSWARSLVFGENDEDEDERTESSRNEDSYPANFLPDELDVTVLRKDVLFYGIGTA